jgi:hypothetical protein
MTRPRSRWLALGGILGPASFIAAWALLGTRASGYSPVDEPISRLAGVGADARGPMTVGIVSLGVGVGAYAAILPSTLGRRTAIAAATTVAARRRSPSLSLGTPVGGIPHAVAAGVAYASLAATPLSAARVLGGRGRIRQARVSVAAGVICGAALLGSATLDTRTGLLQRVGLTVGHMWIAASATSILRRGRAA